MSGSAAWTAVDFVRGVLGEETGHGYALSAGRTWVGVGPRDKPPAEHGWKLHVSSRAADLPALAELVVPVLLRERCHFKLAASQHRLARINEGWESPAAVGKAVTVYPDGHRVRALGLHLADLLRGRPGPRILSDRRVAPDAPVYYRYGPFTARWIPDRRGVLSVGIPGPDGTVFKGAATLEYRSPGWASDPFAPDGGSDGHPSGEAAKMVGDRYRPVAGIYRSAKGNVFRAVDLGTGRTVVIKQARALVAEDADGFDTRTRLRNERRVLEHCRGIPGVPVCLDHFAHGEDEFLVTSEVGEHNLLFWVIQSGGRLPRLRRIVAELAATVRALHDAGVVMRDISARNVVLGADRAHLVDFGISALDGLHLPGATRGYAPLRQLAGEPPRREDDCYALGMVVVHAATGMTPLTAVRNSDLARHRALQALAGADPDEAPPARLIMDLLSEDPVRTRHALDELASPTATSAGAHRAPAPHPTTPRDRADSANASAPCALPPLPEVNGETVRALRERTLDQLLNRLSEPDEAEEADSFAAVDASVYTGSAGIGLELLHHGERPGAGAALDRLVALTRAALTRVTPIPGLYSGVTGVAVFFAAAERAGITVPHLEAAPDPDEPDGDDVMVGWAGVGLANLTLARTAPPGSARRARHLRAVLRCAGALYGRTGVEGSAAKFPGPVAPPGGRAAASSDPSFGYAHGQAGVVGFLVEAADATGDPWVRRDAERRAADLAARTTRLTAAVLDGPAMPLTASWCQGLAGAAAPLIRAGQVLDDPELSAAGTAAGEAMTGLLPRMDNLGQCCGVSGVGTALIDMAVATGQKRYLKMARTAARQLLARSHGPDGNPSFIDPTQHEAPLSWAMGLAGILTFLRRLADPDSPALLGWPLGAAEQAR
ncbi:class IV lanthionine synthetase LanL [Streptomyces sp. NPDC018019]|uniref:class IV lanthionine synthetase LanL n=1 Tax=Streptomyces sp. NPDC018019 TaxID=3365030 RepID=UPI003787D932